MLTISLMVLDHMRLHTWEPVSTDSSGVAVVVFQNRMQRSAVPPPDANRPAHTREEKTWVGRWVGGWVGERGGRGRASRAR